MTRILIPGLLSAVALAYGQAAVESAIITGAGGTGTAGAAKGVGKNVGAIFGRVNAELERAAKGASSASPKPSTAASKASGAPAADLRSTFKPEDLKVGMTRDELIALAGKPALSIAGAAPGSELLCFVLKSGGSIDVVVSGGKVAEVTAQP